MSDLATSDDKNALMHLQGNVISNQTTCMLVGSFTLEMNSAG